MAVTNIQNFHSYTSSQNRNVFRINPIATVAEFGRMVNNTWQPNFENQALVMPQNLDFVANSY